MASHNSSSTIKIPARTSALIAPSRQVNIVKLKSSTRELKRKASVLSDHSGGTATEFVDLQIEICKTRYELASNVYWGLKEALEEGRMTGQEFKEDGKELWRKRLRLQEDYTTLLADRNAVLEKVNQGLGTWSKAYEAATLALFTSKKGHLTFGRRNKHNHQAWKATLKTWYNVMCPNGDSATEAREWCPILKEYGIPKHRRAAHIIPHFVGYENVAYILGQQDDMAKGFNMIWDLRNGLIMADTLEAKFDNGDFVIVPIDTPANQPQRLRFVLLNHAIAHHQVSDQKIYYSQMDGTELQFKSNARPGLRFLYWHYVTSILRAIKWGTVDQKNLKQQFPAKQMWATPGPYLRKSMLRHLARAIGDYDLADDEFSEGASGEEEPDTKSMVHAAALAAQVASNLDIDDSEDEDKEDLAEKKEDDDDDDDDDEF